MTETIAPSLPPPPRPVHRRAGSGWDILFVRLITLPHVAAGIWLVLLVFTRLYVQCSGTLVTATVDHSELRASKKGGSILVYYHYWLNDRRHDELTTLNSDSPDRARPGFTFTGRASELRGHAMFLSSTDSITRETLPLAGAAIFWNGILSIIVYHAWVIPIRQRWVAKTGKAADGVITGRKKMNGKPLRYVVMYRFAAYDGRRIEGKCDVSSAAYDRAYEGAPVTVLYSRNHPQWNLPYEYGDYIVAAKSDKISLRP